jgi:stage II sporulation protein D
MHSCSSLRRASLYLIMVAMGAGCAGGPAPPAAPLVSGSIALPHSIKVSVSGQVTSIPIEEYVLGTALSEVSPVGDTPDSVAGIYRVQAIIARTYAAFHPGRHAKDGFDLCDTTHCQVYQPGRVKTSRFSAAARQAVADTQGQVLAYGTRPAEALFHADCGGHTVAAEVIWGGRVPYLVGTVDEVPAETHRQWQFHITREQLRAALNANSLTAVGDALRSMRIMSRDPSGRAATIEVVGDTARTLRGEQLRAVVNQQQGPLAVRSTKFALTLEADGYRFDGAGWGHGVGLCQVGAMARIRRGDSVPSVLTTYYPGARLLRAR